MIVAAHQPVYLPGIIFFNKLSLCDTFVFLSDVQLARGRSWQTRNRIRQGENAAFLSVPVQRKGLPDQRICDTKIASDQDWQRRHISSLRHAYSKSPYFSRYFADLTDIIKQPWSTLADLNIALIRHLAECFGLSPIWHDSSHFELPEGKNERLIALSHAVGCNTYLSNVGSTSYVQEDAFTEKGVKHLWQHFQHPVYDQGAPFLSNLSAVDLLFNLGPNATSIVLSAGVSRPERPVENPDQNGDDW